jgi:hypothetical protein
MTFRRFATGAALALVGLAAAVGIGLLANTISGDSVGLGAEPLSAGETLAPAAPRSDDRAEQRQRQRQRRNRNRNRDDDDGVRTTESPEIDDDFADPTEPPEDNSGSGSDSDNSGSGSDNSGSEDSGQGRGRGRGGDGISGGDEPDDD